MPRRKDLDWNFRVQHERTFTTTILLTLGNRFFQLDTTGWRNTLAGQRVMLTVE